MSKYIYTDGAKSVNIQDSWDFVDVMKSGNIGNREIQSRVAAASRARTLKATAVSNVPFVIVNKSGDELDSSGDWQNIVKVMPKPRDLIRRLQLSLMDNNGAYLRMGQSVLKTPKQLHYAKYSSIVPITDPVSGELLYLERWVNGTLEKRYAPDDKGLIRFWMLDDTTELLPSAETETLSVLSSCGILFYSDQFTENFYRRGGIKPTLIAMKGLVSPDKAGELQKDWTSFVRGIAGYARSVSAKIFNAETMDIKAFGEGLGDLKETPVYRQALENIAIGRGMPLSLLLSNSANKATADVEYVQWFRNDIVPAFDFIADVLNDSVFIPMGYQIQNRAETVDPEQEDEVARVNALSSYGDALAKYPDADTFLSAAQGVFGYELPEAHVEAIYKYYASKKAEPVEIAPAKVEPVEEPEDDMETEDVTEVPEAKWIPSVDELNELRVWCDVALRRHKKGDSLAFEYQPHYGGLPEGITKFITAKLSLDAKTVEDIKAAFNVAQYTTPPSVTIAPEYKSEILILAEALNNLANAKQD